MPPQFHEKMLNLRFLDDVDEVILGWSEWLVASFCLAEENDPLMNLPRYQVYPCLAIR